VERSSNSTIPWLTPRSIGANFAGGTYLNHLFRPARSFCIDSRRFGNDKHENATTEKPATQKTFASPGDAGTAFFEAAKSGDQSALLAIFGPDARDVLFSGDPVKDKDALRDFVAAYDQMHRWLPIKAGGEILYTGADNFPFPIPLGQHPSGQWYFDTAAGKDEILARRIGKGELTAIAACGAIADAQQQYFSQTHDSDKVKQYAQKFVSDEGKHNGLYWPAPEGQTPSPLGQLGDFAPLLASPLGTDFYCLEICPSIVGVPDVNKLQYRLLLLLRHFVGYLRSKETLHAAKSCFIFGR
jgi:hypothetical protein